MRLMYAAKIDELRKAILLTNETQAVLTKRAGIGNATLHSALKGNAVTVSTANKIAKALGVSVTDIFA